MNILVALSLFGWPAIALGAFIVARPIVAITFVVIGGWMFLPHSGFPIQGFIDYNKTTAIGFACICGIGAFDTQRLTSFRPHLYDLPMLLVCIVPVISTLSVGGGLKLGVSTAIIVTFAWGVPYFVGRLYFSERESHQILALGIFIGVLIYVPLCLYEIRMSPQLNLKLYGFRIGGFATSARGGGWRPTVFMSTGLMLSLWMAVGGMIAFYFWLSGGVKRVMGVPMSWIMAAMVGTAVLCKSSGATLLMLLGSIAFVEGRVTRTRALFWSLVLFPPIYVAARVLGLWSGDELAVLAEMISPERAESLLYRMDMEDAIMESIGSKSILGRGPTNFLTILDEQGESASAVSDSVWIIQYARFGGVGLLVLGAAFVIPLVKFVPMVQAANYAKKEWVCQSCLAMGLAIFMFDCVLNQMVNPAYLLIMGGLTGYVANAQPSR